ncbi:TniQ family protein [Cupriavidus campinensis]|uniref:TniQ family protein n=1 Tax=Cupriavidus campinensis TaxID=151783 RepID=UPI0011EF0D35
MRVLIRVKPIEEEWIYGYVSRVATENGIDERVLLAATGINHRPMQADVGRLSEHFRILPDEATQLSGLWKVDYLGRYFCHVGRLMLPEHLLVSRQRFPKCMRCMQEDGYQKGIWACQLFTCCPKHRIRLYCACPACGRPVDTDPCARVVHCICGTDLLSSKEASAGEVALASILDGGRLRDVPENLAVGLRLLANEPVERMLRTLYFLGDIFYPQFGRMSLQGARRLSRGFITGEILSLLSDWPRGFIQEIEVAVVRASKPDATSDAIRIRRIMRRCFAEFLPDCSPFVRSAFEVAFRENSARTSRKSPSLQIQECLDF